MALNMKRERFCVEYIVDYNATQAAIRAGYSTKSAYSQGSALMKDPEVRARIADLQKAIEATKIADATEVLQFATAVMRGEVKEEVVVVEAIGDYMSSAKVMEKQVSAKDRLKANENLMRHHRLMTDNTNLTGNLGVTIVDDIPNE